MAEQTPVLLDVVRRYLDALSSASIAVRRREHGNCKQLLAFLGAARAPALSRETLAAWLDATGEDGIEARRRRLTTARRLVALTPGEDAERLAVWIDQNRQRLSDGDDGRRVIKLRPDAPTERVTADRYAEHAETIHREGGRTQAAALARRALRHDPVCLRALALLGVLDLEAHRPELALRRFREALVLAGDPVERNGTEGIAAVLDGLGRTLIAVGQLGEAYEVYRRLRTAGPRWNAHASPILGRIALLRDEPEAAAEWLQSSSPIEQFSVFFCRALAGDVQRALIALCRGLLANPFVPPVLLHAAQWRFEESFDPARLEALKVDARRYALEWGDVWARQPALAKIFRELWDHPATRAYLMRVLPLAERDAASPRLAVFVHATASSLRKFLLEVGLVVPEGEE